MSRAACAVGVLVAVALGATLPATAAAARPKKVDVAATVSGSTLKVEVDGPPRAECALALGLGDRAQALPSVTTGAKGRGAVSWAIPSAARTGRRAVSATCAHDGRTRAGRTFVALEAVSAPAKGSAMATVLNVLLDLLLGGSLLIFVWLLIDMVVRATDQRERVIRSLALIGGAVIALGAESSGVSFADFTIDSLTGARPGGEAFRLAAVAVPGGISALFGWYFVRVMNRDADMGLRLMSFLGMLTVVAFAVIFAQATNVQGVILGAAAIPNASFVAGLIFSVVVFTPTSDGARRKAGRLSSFRDFVRRRGASRAGLVPGGPEAPAPAAAARNPFADD